MIISSRLIKEEANRLGFEKVGIAKATATPNDQKNLEVWLNEGKQAGMDWIKKRKDERGNIHTYYPDAKSVVSVGMNYYTGKNQNDLESDYKFSNYAWGEDYHHVLKKKLFKLSRWLEKFCPESKNIVCVDTSPVMEKVWAQRSGIGWIGKHTNLITRDYGSWIFLGEIVSDIKLEYDIPFQDDLCGTCTACIDECPTHALTEYILDANKCISYQTIEHKGGFPDGAPDLDGWVFGCDICQEICPWNQKFAQEKSCIDFQPRDSILNYDNEQWENISEEQFQKIFKNSAIKRTKYAGLKRNILKNKDT